MRCDGPVGCSGTGERDCCSSVPHALFKRMCVLGRSSMYVLQMYTSTQPHRHLFCHTAPWHPLLDAPCGCMRVHAPAQESHSAPVGPACEQAGLLVCGHLENGLNLFWGLLALLVAGQSPAVVLHAHQRTSSGTPRRCNCDRQMADQHATTMPLVVPSTSAIIWHAPLQRLVG